MMTMAACNKMPDISPDTLDGTFIYDPSLADPEQYLISYALPNPDAIEAAKPVFVAVHGYSASTFEWDELADFAQGQSDYYVSRVLMGGHGRTYEDFKKSSWRDWQQSIKDEYEALLKAGYSNINLVGSSTSCTLIIDLIASGYFKDKIAPKNILLVDPIVIPSDKLLSLVGIIGPLLGYVEADNTTEEDKYWYHYKPQETLQNLQEIIKRVRKQLEDGIKLPADCRLKVYKTIQDPTADPVSAVLIYHGIETQNGGRSDLEMITSNLHVFTRLALREDLSPLDYQNQLNAFKDFVSRATN